MQEEKFVLNCPKCGRVEGFFPSAEGESDDAPEEEMIIDEDVVQTPAGPKMRVRCPSCGQWIAADRARPA